MMNQSLSGENVLEMTTSPFTQVSSINLPESDSLPLQIAAGGPLIQHLNKQKHVIWFIKICGLIWFIENSDEILLLRILQYFWTGAMHVALPVYLVLNVSFLFNDSTRNFAGYYIYGVLVAQALVLIPAIKAMKIRLQNEVPQIDLVQYPVCLKWAWICFVITALVACVYFALEQLFLQSTTENLSADTILFVKIFSYLTIFCQLPIACFLSANLLFISVDCKVSVALLNRLTALHETNSLTMDIFNDVRDEIKKRVQNSLKMNYALIIVALLNVIGVIVWILAVSPSQNQIGGSIAVLSMFVKVFPFLIITFFMSAQVNEVSDQLTKQLGCSKWDKESDYIQRMSLYINADASKISFPLASFRFNYRDIIRQICAWILAIVVAIVKSLFRN